MYIMTKEQRAVIDFGKVDGAFVGNDDNAIKTISRDRLLIQVLGIYETHEMAMAVLNDLVTHIPQGGVYRMPDDERARILLRGMQPEDYNKFAGNGKKTVRRGGS